MQKYIAPVIAGFVAAFVVAFLLSAIHLRGGIL
jgi:hypothetical protein